MKEWYPISQISSFLKSKNGRIVHCSVRDDGVIRKLAAYVVLGINEDGMKEVLCIVVGENESSKY